MKQFNLNKALVLVLSLACGFKALTAHATDGTWTNLNGGSWASTANWSNDTIASGAGANANFNTLSLGANQAVTLDGTQTVGNLFFDDKSATKHTWVLGTGTGGLLTLSSLGGGSTINVSNTAFITAVVAGNSVLNKQRAVTLVLSHTNTFIGSTIISAGNLIVSNVNALSTGNVQINPGAPLNLNAGSAGYNITNLIVQNGGSVELFLGST